ncbi:hypothetical protein QBC37DRAFT_370432 [Rhypophila decipiens]|uniref:Uncharacterized protein n=1 Tax=Rhypophila decipiens TaxID=261697 RepID=A0AAN6YHY1_9PEZI|nr:hypothetical protein QBC37DRAFT_370432 [Rhypophila decipiens]
MVFTTSTAFLDIDTSTITRNTATNLRLFPAAHILRSFLKQPGSPNIPIQAIGLSLYESLPTSDDQVVEEPDSSPRSLPTCAYGELQTSLPQRWWFPWQMDNHKSSPQQLPIPSARLMTARHPECVKRHGRR